MLPAMLPRATVMGRRFIRPGLPGSRDRHGAAVVELACLLPLLLFLFVISVDYARIFYMSVTITNCASLGAVYGSSSPIAASDTTGITSRIQKDAGNLDLKKLTISTKNDTSTKPGTITVSASYPFTTVTNFPGVPSSQTLTRTVKMNVAPLTPN